MEIQLKSSQKLGTGCLTLFLLPFCAMGVVLAGAGLYKLAQGQWKDGLPMLGVGLLFSAVGFGMLWMVRRGVRQQQQVERIKQEHPDEPWRWRPEWAGGQIRSSTKGVMAFAWVFALFGNAIAWPVCFVLPGELEKGNKGVLVALISPAVGIGLLAWAIRATLQWRKFGETLFVMNPIPASPGGALAGALRTGGRFRSEEGLHLKLSCINRVVTGSGKHQSTHEHVRWQEEQTILRDDEVPVFFRIPSDCAETDDRDRRNRMLWHLEASAKMPGVDYYAQFEVPVFRIAGPIPEIADPAATLRQSEAVNEPPREMKVRVDRSACAGPEFYFPPARNPGVALGLTAFFLIWTGAIVLMIRLGAPVLFPIVFGFFDVFILYGLFQLWLGTTKIVFAGPGRMRITRGLPGLARTRMITTGEIAEIKPEVGMQSGSTVYYDIKIHLTSGRKITAGGLIKSKREAQWIIDQLCDCLSGR